MKEIKLWRISNGQASEAEVQEIDRVQNTDTEYLLESVLTQKPQLLMEDLHLVGRQTETPGGPLDLLGVDGDGRLVVFELKRGALTRDAVAQVIDYASFLSELEAEEIAAHISERSGKLGIEEIEDFLGWYQEQFGRAFTNREQPRLLLVGLGADDRTRRMVSFLAESDVEISLITFHGFMENGQLMLARQVEVQQKEAADTMKNKKQRNLDALNINVREKGVESFYNDMASFFRDELIAPYEVPNPTGYSYYLQHTSSSGNPSNRVYVALYLNMNKSGEVKITFFPRAIEAAGEVFQNFSNEMGDRLAKATDGLELLVRSVSEWQELKLRLSSVNKAIFEGWKKKKEQQSQDDLSGQETYHDQLGEGA
jgi:hypothetical protein